MISSILFDFGGTLDADGLHWLDRFYSIYQHLGVNIAQPRLKEAFYYADAQAEVDSGIRESGLRDMMERHVHWQFEKLKLNNPAQKDEAVTAFSRPAERILRRNRKILEKLSAAGYKLGIISNFYGNIAVLCREFGYTPFLKVILDSAVIGLKKPDPAIFQKAMEELAVSSPREIAFVGDSFERDILPAKALGMKTCWLRGPEVRTCPDPSKVDLILHSLEDLPVRLAHVHEGL